MSYVGPKGFLKGFEVRHFLDTPEEWPALVNGFCEVLCPWPSRWPLMDEKRAKEIRAEYHYYQFGRAIGVIAWLIIAKVIQEAFF